MARLSDVSLNGVFFSSESYDATVNVNFSVLFCFQGKNEPPCHCSEFGDLKES